MFIYFKTKKRILTLTLALAIVLSLFYTPLKAAADGINYTNDKLGFSLAIPAGWAGKYRVSDFSVAAEFINIRNEAAGCGGFLFSIMVSNSMEPLEWNGFKLLGQSGGVNYFAGLPSDVQFDHANTLLMNEYQSMEKDIDAILKSFRIGTESSADNLTIFLDGIEVAADAAPFIDANSRTMVPVKFISEALGAKVDWDGNTRLVTVTKGMVVINLTIGSNQIITNGKATTMDTAAVIKDSRTFVPVKYIAEALGLSVGWDGAARTVILTSAGQPNADVPYIGLWHESPVVPSGFAQRLALNADHSFIWAASQMDGQERTRFSSGSWSVANGKLLLTATEEIRWEGGREVPAFDSWGTDTVIMDADIVVSKLAKTTEYAISCVTTDSEVFDKRTVTIGGLRFWELDHPLDMETLKEDYSAAKADAGYSNDYLPDPWEWTFSDGTGTTLNNGLSFEFANTTKNEAVELNLTEASGEYSSVGKLVFSDKSVSVVIYMDVKEYGDFWKLITMNRNIIYGDRVHEDMPERRAELSRVFRIYANGVELGGEMSYTQGNGSASYIFIYDKSLRLDDIETLRLEIGYKQ